MLQTVIEKTMSFHRMKMLAVVATCAAIAMAADWPRRARTCVPRSCGIPDANYRFDSRSTVGTATSRPPILLPGSSESESGGRISAAAGQSGESRARAKLFQMESAGISIDQCSISNIAVTLDELGTWSLSLRADQNQMPDRSEFLPTAHILRNKFHVKLRFYSSLSDFSAPETVMAGRPCLSESAEIVFWVQRNEPAHIKESRTQDELKNKLDLIDRVDVDFFYDHGTAVQLGR